MRNLILPLAVCLCLSGCFGKGKPVYTSWSVKNCTDRVLTLLVAGNDLSLAPQDEKLVADDYKYNYSRRKTDESQSFEALNYRGEISLYIDGKPLASWKPVYYGKQYPAGFHFFNPSCWTYRFEKPDTHIWTLEIHPEDIGQQTE